MSRNVVIVGKNAALAKPIIEHFRCCEDVVTEVGRGDSLKGIADIDVLVTMMGKTRDAKLDGMTADQWGEVCADTLGSVVCVLSFLGSSLKANSNGVVFGSVVGSSGGYGCANYAAAKAGLVGLVRAAANEWASRGVCINLLELGFTELGMGARLEPKVKERALESIPLKRFGTAEDVVLAVDFLSRTRYMTGNVLTLAGGLR